MIKMFSYVAMIVALITGVILVIMQFIENVKIALETEDDGE